MLSTDTTQKLDLLVRAVEQGKFDEILGKIQFIDALKGTETDRGFEHLVGEVNRLNRELQIMTDNYMAIKTDMTYICQAVRAVLEMNKKLDWNKGNIESVCSRHGAY
jgi:hypothetical protein